MGINVKVRCFQRSPCLPEARRLASWYSWRRFPGVFPNASKRNVIVKIASNARQNVPHWNTCSLQLRFVSDARLHEQLRRVDRTERENYLSCSLGAKILTLILELDPHRAVGVE